MTNKNPYEVRLDILKMAHEMTKFDFEVRETHFMTRVNALNIEKQPGPAINEIFSKAPTPPTPGDVISKALTLYGFVEDNSSLKKN